MGKRYLRRPLYLGAIAQVSARRRAKPGDDWLWKIIQRKKPKQAAIALANRMARTAFAVIKNKTEFRAASAPLTPLRATGKAPLPRRQVHREMMANDGYIAGDTLFEPERQRARAIDWDKSGRGLSSGRAANVLQSRRRIHGRNRNHASFN
jgi:hypothetical protein